eukprot:4406400-Amphidinium_carterae.1
MQGMPPAQSSATISAVISLVRSCCKNAKVLKLLKCVVYQSFRVLLRATVLSFKVCWNSLCASSGR